MAPGRWSGQLMFPVFGLACGLWGDERESSLFVKGGNQTGLISQKGSITHD
jgi:hypothetical protein